MVKSSCFGIFYIEHDINRENVANIFCIQIKAVLYGPINFLSTIFIEIIR